MELLLDVDFPVTDQVTDVFGAGDAGSGFPRPFAGPLSPATTAGGSAVVHIGPGDPADRAVLVVFV